MKIIKEGAVPTFRSACGFCGCILECEKSEGCVIFKDSGFPELSVRCPTCNTTVHALPVYPLPPNNKYRNE